MTYFRKIGSIVSQGANVILLNGNPDESLSAKAYRRKDDKRWWKFIFRAANLIFGKKHCYSAYMTDVQHARDVLNINREF